MSIKHKHIQIWAFFKQYYKYGASVFWINIILVSVVGPASAVLALGLQRYTINALIQKRGIVEILTLVLFLVFLQCFISVFIVAIETFCIDIKSQEIKFLLMQEIYQIGLKVDTQNFDDSEFYNCYSWTMREYCQKCRDAMALIVRTWGAIVSSIVLIIAFLSWDWIIVSLTLFSMAINTSLGIQLNKKRYLKKEEMVLDERKLSYVNRIFYQDDLIKDIKLSGAESKILRFYRKSSEAVIDVHKKYSREIFILRTLLKCVSHISLGTLSIYLAFQTIEGRIDIGGFATFLSASNMLKSHFVSVFDAFKISKEYDLYSVRIDKFFNSEKKIEDDNHNEKLSQELNSPKMFEISFENVFFDYGEKKSFCLSNINFRIAPGQKIAVVGNNGSGKTTLIKLLLRLYDPCEGSIMVNGINIRDFDVREYRQSIGVSTQSAPILAFSIYDNLSIYSRNNIEKSIEVTGFGKVLKRRNSTMDTLLTKEFDSSGIVLSGGEKRLLSLAKVIGGDFGLIVLDEPSSFLDPLVESEIMNYVFDKKNQTTMLIVSHRLINIVEADFIVVMEDGCIVETGTHAQLMKRKGKYYNMFLKQTMDSICPQAKDDTI